jgi:hypothetical protein
MFNQRKKSDQVFADVTPYYAEQLDYSPETPADEGQVGRLSDTEIMRLQQERDDLNRSLRRQGLTQAERSKIRHRIGVIETDLRRARAWIETDTRDAERQQERKAQTGANTKTLMEVLAETNALCARIEAQRATSAPATKATTTKTLKRPDVDPLKRTVESALAGNKEALKMFMSIKSTIGGKK